MRIILGVILVALSPAIFAKAPVWIELAEKGQVLARTIVNSDCPAIVVDGKSLPMQARGVSQPSASNTPPEGQRLVCEKNVTGAVSVRVAGMTVLLLGAENLI